MMTGQEISTPFERLKETRPDLYEAVQNVFSDTVETRRQIRRHPELAFQETETAKLVAGRLKEWGYEVQEGVGGTGVVGVLKGARPGPVVGLRADMDALPMNDLIDEPYRSEHGGIAHTCGHDAHTAILLGAAKVFSQAGLSRGSLKVIFQPAEEIGEGAAAMIRDGALGNPDVDVMAGLHVHPTVCVGEFSLATPEFTCAAVDLFELEFRGQGGHAAHPHETVDPIMMTAQALVTLQQIVSRQTDPLDSVVLSFGQIHAGTKDTIIPDAVKVSGTVRTLKPETRNRMEERIRSIASGIASGLGGSCTLDYRYGPPSIKVGEVPRRMLEETISRLFGSDALKETAPSMGGEDFSYFSNEVPSVFFRLGTNGGERTAYPNHNARFDVDEQSFLYGISTLVELTNTFLEKDKGEFV
ncbi:M20 metallopeptidase family protein [Edaphobacillus lindanitolerans]|uniref:Amidohydrolase n=1 Tax=Edaphobacillus lindanitolerans TaxID=550447 RepID=A0A1U7PKC5_9BACI|nr:M20 family metallopeptidase [Edaphobacillus lindanitolerans]SIT72803.1 amidohydrolase [Edaphobacillus lindanitolerans]